MEKKTPKSSPKKLRFSVSLLPLSFLVFQAVLLIFEIFQIHDIEAVNSMREFIRGSTLFLSLLFIFFLLGFMFTTLSKKKNQRDWKYTLINSGICAANVAIINEWYHSDKLEAALSSLLEKPVFVVLSILALVILTVITLNNSKGDSSDRKPPSKPIIESSARVESAPASNPAQSQPAGSVDGRMNKLRDKLLFSIIFAVLFFIIGILVYFVISRYDIIAPVLADEDATSRYLSSIFLIILGIAAVFIIVIVLTYVTRYICGAFLSLPEFLNGVKQPEARIVKVAFGIIGVPVFYMLGKLFQLNMNWLLNLVQNRDYLVIPFTILLYFLLSMLFVEILYDLFSGKSERRWAKKFKKIIVDAGDSIIGICGSIIGSFLNLLKFPPDFLVTIEELLLGIEPDPPADKSDPVPKGEDPEEKG